VIGVGLEAADFEADHHVCHLLSADVSTSDGRPHQSDAVKADDGVTVVRGAVVSNGLDRLIKLRNLGLGHATSD